MITLTLSLGDLQHYLIEILFLLNILAIRRTTAHPFATVRKLSMIHSGSFPMIKNLKNMTYFYFKNKKLYRFGRIREAWKYPKTLIPYQEL